MALHVARWSDFGYCGQTLDRGQVVNMQGAANDEKLLRLGYITPVNEKNPKLLECGVCGARFLDDAARSAHGRRRHPERARRQASITPSPVVDPGTGEPSSYIDTEGDREEKQNMEQSPLYLDKTEANRR